MKKNEVHIVYLSQDHFCVKKDICVPLEIPLSCSAFLYVSYCIAYKFCYLACKSLVFIVTATLPAVFLRARGCLAFVILFSDLYMLNLTTVTKDCFNTLYFNLAV